MKWKLTIVVLLVALFLGLCLWLHFGRVNRSPVYVKKIEKDSGFKATFDKKKGTLTIVRSDRRQAGPSNGAKPSFTSESGEKGERTDVLKFSRRSELDYDEHTRVLKVFAPKSGFVFEPGVSGMLSQEHRLRLGLDVQFFFYKRWGIVTGVSGTTGQRISPAIYIGATWQPSEEYFTNTNLLVGIDNRKDWYLGFRIGL